MHVAGKVKFHDQTVLKDQIMTGLFCFANSVMMCSEQHSIQSTFAPLKSLEHVSYTVHWQRGPGSWLIVAERRGVMYGYGQLDWLGPDLWLTQPFLSPCLCLSHTHSAFLVILKTPTPCCLILCSCASFMGLLTAPQVLWFPLCLIQCTFYTIILRHHRAWDIDLTEKLGIIWSSVPKMKN